MSIGNSLCGGIVTTLRRAHRESNLGWGVLALLAMTSAAEAAVSNDVFQESSGIVVIEMESSDAAAPWALRTDVGGFTGSSYLVWEGPNLFNTPGQGIFGFDFEIHEPGEYSFRIRNHHDHPDSTEENDTWVRMDGGTWIKAFSGTRNSWTWATNHELDNNNKPPASYQLAGGVHRIEFSGRSENFRMDRFHLFRPGHPDGSNPGATESSTTPGTATNHPPVARFNISPDEVPAIGSNAVITLNAGPSFDPDAGQRLSYRWDVRGVRYVEGTTRDSGVAKIRLLGGTTRAVRLTVRDDAEESLFDIEYGVINVVEDNDARVHGAPVAWQPLEVWFQGPTASEMDAEPNPFLDYRLQVTFTGPAGQTYEVPGFFDGDGNGNGVGDIWKARFSADEGGPWSYQASFRSGSQVAVSLGASAGEPAAFDGASGEFYVFSNRVPAPGLLSKGRLEYVGEHYLKFRDGGYFLKGGTDSPENMMGFKGFDDIQDNGGVGIIHEFAAHISDWNLGDPLFTSNTTGVDSRGLIGALNYLGEKHVNSIYFLPMNLGGDGQETCPFVGYSNSVFNKCHYDVSRLHQWNRVFNHAQEQGLLLHFVLAETESANENWLDGGNLGPERKLFYRELIARFGHLLAIKWNLSEENDYSVSELTQFAAYIDAQDAYDHPIAVHTHPNNFQDYEAIAGNPLFSATSIQYDTDMAGSHTEEWRAHSAAMGHKWVIDMDENNPYHTGLTSTNADDLRKRVLYDVYFSGGQVEWYMGYHSLPLGGDLRCEDFGTREAMWNYMWFARRLMQQHMPFWEMEPADGLLSGESGNYGGGQVFAKPEHTYAVYMPNAQQSGQLNLTGAPGRYRARWFNPRSGQFEGESRIVVGGGIRNLGPAPGDPSEDWVVLLKNIQRR
ncbi:MAG: hypothetical protein ACI8QZ_001093 [Chlamydiales bacterium]|jgi:hypothetical protein